MTNLCLNLQFDAYAPGSVDPTPPHVDVLNLETKLVSKEAEIRDLEHQLRLAQETESRAVKSMQQMRERMEYMEKEASSRNAEQSKAELAVHALQADNRQLQDRLSEFESRLRFALIMIIIVVFSRNFLFKEDN